MKQNIKKVLLVLCMAVCFFALTACTDSSTDSEPVPETIESTMITGAENYLKEFDSYDEETLATILKRVQKQKNTVMESAITSWQGSKNDLGKMMGVDTYLVERVDEETYKITVTATYEKRKLLFTLVAEEVIGDSYGGISLAPTEMVFTPEFTTAEKLERAGMNTLMGMGTVFLVLIFISFIIANLSKVNLLEARIREKKEAKQAAARAVIAAKEEKTAELPNVSAAPVSQAPAGDSVPAEVPAPAVIDEEENLADDMELAAVITAAIAAAASVPAEGLVVRSIRRKSGSKWKNA